MEIRNLQNEHRKIIETKGSFSILESSRDLSVSPFNATAQYFMEKSKKCVVIYIYIIIYYNIYYI